MKLVANCGTSLTAGRADSVYAICLQCGATKKEPYAQCDECGFQPTDDESLAKSVYLSLGRYDTPAEQSRYEYELKRLANELRSGREIEFDGEDLARLHAQKLDVESVDDATALRYLLRVVFPGLLFLLVLIGVLIMLRLR
jgi:hypothetical protein